MSHVLLIWKIKWHSKHFFPDGRNIVANSEVTRNRTQLSQSLGKHTNQSAKGSNLLIKSWRAYTSVVIMLTLQEAYPTPILHHICSLTPGNVNQSLVISAHISLFISTWCPVAGWLWDDVVVSSLHFSAFLLLHLHCTSL